MLSFLLMGVLIGGSPPASTPNDLQTRDDLSFKWTIRPVLERSCLHCHGNGRVLNGKFDARTLQSLQRPSENGVQLVPGNPEKSLLWVEILKDDMMPPKGEGRLTPAEKRLIYDWIKAGCP